MGEMRSNDWGGNPPENVEQAKQKILNGAITCVERYGLSKTNIKRVAEEVGVTRQTVYRYFSSSDELLTAVSFFVGGGLMQKMIAHIGKFTSFEDKLIESVLFLVKTIPSDTYLNQYFSLSTDYSSNIEMVFSSSSLEYAYQAVKSMYSLEPISKQEAAWLRGLSEHALRLVLALIITPTQSIRTRRSMRRYLDQWVRPLLIFEV